MELSLLHRDAALPGGQDFQPGGQAGEVLQRYAGGEGGHVALLQGCLHPGVIHFIHMVAGAGEAVVQRAVVGEQQQALGVLIQPAHRGQILAPPGGGDEVQHRRGGAVLGGGEDAGRLMEQDIEIGLVGQALAVHGDGGGFGHLLLRRGGADAVHRHPAQANQLFDLPAGILAGGGNAFIQTLHRRHLPFLAVSIAYFGPVGNMVGQRR